MSEKQVLTNLLAELGIDLRAEFVPWSKSRHAKEKDKSLNWKVTLLKDNRPILTTDYSAGIGHCPAYNLGYKNSMLRMTTDRYNDIVFECEKGVQAANKHKPILPCLVDVVNSLVLETDVLDYGSFEEWANSLGYNSDSREAEKIYQLCLSNSLKLRNGLGDTILSQLRSAYQDY